MSYADELHQIGARADADLTAAGAALTGAQAQVADLTGRLATADATIADLRAQIAGARGMVVGAALAQNPGESWQACFDRSNDAFGPIGILRQYFTQAAFEAGTVLAETQAKVTNAGRPIPRAWTTKGDMAALAAATPAVVAKYRSQVHAISAQATAWRVPIYLDLWHEPEQEINAGQFTAAQFVAANRTFLGLVKAENNPLLIATWCIENYTVNGGEKFTAEALYPGDDVVDFHAWDINAFTGNAKVAAAGYPDPNKPVTPTNPNVGQLCAAFSKKHGKPWGVAEWGSGRIPSDTTGAGRAAFITTQSEWYRAQGARWIAYFNSAVGGESRIDYPSAGTPECVAMKAQAARNGLLP